jgi:hypothetical protein
VKVGSFAPSGGRVGHGQDHQPTECIGGLVVGGVELGSSRLRQPADETGGSGNLARGRGPRDDRRGDRGGSRSVRLGSAGGRVLPAGRRGEIEPADKPGSVADEVPPKSAPAAVQGSRAALVPTRPLGPGLQAAIGVWGPETPGPTRAGVLEVARIEHGREGG